MRRLYAIAVLLACGKPAPLDPLIVETANGLSIRREVVRVKAPKPAPNPVTSTATPDALDSVDVVRYRVDTAGGAPKPARAIFVLMPGFLGGGGSFDGIARALVRRSTADAPFEVWGIDRRANLLEDRTGIEAALDAGSADTLTSYYFEPGSKFSGFVNQADVAYESEWGMASTIADLRAVIALVPEADRRARVVLAGHSLGGTIVAQYAAWDFDGRAGHEELAGLVMIDSVTGREGEPIAVTREGYETTGLEVGVTGGLMSLRSIRESVRYVALPILESGLYPLGIGAALRARVAPEALERDVPRAEAMKTVFGLSTLPRFTNRAAFGLVFDTASCPVGISSVNAGAAEGGELTASPPLFGGTGTTLKPTQADATYRWREYDQVEPHESTSLTDFALAWTRSGSDFGEWYFPARLSLDSQIGENLVVGPNEWPVDFGVRAFHGRELSVPLLVEAAGILSGRAQAYDKLKAMLPPVGEGRPLSGATRATTDGWEALSHPEYSHLDPLTAADVPGSAAAGWYDALAGFALRNTPAGGVSVP